MPSSLMVNYQLSLNHLKLTFGASIKDNVHFDRSKYLDLALGIDYKKHRLSLHLANAFTSRPNNLDVIQYYQDSLYMPFLSLGYSYEFITQNFKLRPNLNILANHRFLYTALSILAEHEKINAQFFLSSKKEWSLLLGKRIKRFNINLGYERQLEEYLPCSDVGLHNYLLNRHYIVAQFNYSF